MLSEDYKNKYDPSIIKDKIKEELDQQDIDKVFKELCRVGCSYTNELAKILFMEWRKVNGILNHLSKLGKVRKLNLHPDLVPKELMPKLGDLWRKGIQGYEAFSRMSFYVPTLRIIQDQVVTNCNECNVFIKIPVITYRRDETYLCPYCAGTQLKIEEVIKDDK